MSAMKRPVTGLLVVVGLVLAAFAFTTSASAYPDNRTASLRGSASAVSPGGSLTVSGTHFKGMVTLKANGRSGDMTVGAIMAGADGSFSMRVTLPAGEFPTGSYTITATDGFGDVQTITVSVVSAAAASPGNSGSGSSGSGTSGSGTSGLPNTGMALLSIGGVGVLLLLGGGLMLLTGRRRQATV